MVDFSGEVAFMGIQPLLSGAMLLGFAALGKWEAQSFALAWWRSLQRLGAGSQYAIPASRLHLNLYESGDLQSECRDVLQFASEA